MTGPQESSVQEMENRNPAGRNPFLKNTAAMSARKCRFQLEDSISKWIWLFILSLVSTAIIAFALETELAWLNGLTLWNNTIHNYTGKLYLILRDTNLHHPFLACSYDLLAFAHLVIAIAFSAVLKDPVRNKWLVQTGGLACCLVIPFALLAGELRNLPLAWQLIDCGFGLCGLILLTLCYRQIRALERLLHPASLRMA